MSFVTTILFVLSVAALLAVSKYINATSRERHTTNSAILIDMIQTLKYKKSSIDNGNYVSSDNQDAKELDKYRDFLKSGILDLIY